MKTTLGSDRTPAIIQFPPGTSEGQFEAFSAELDVDDGLVTALARAQANFTEVKRTKRGQVRGREDYRYAGLDDVLRAILPALNAEGVFLAQDVVTDGGVLECSLYLFRGGERMEFGPFRLPVPGDPQAVGSAETYSRRYQIEAALGLAAEDDDDGAAAVADPGGAPVAGATKAAPTKAQGTILARLMAEKGQTTQNVVDWCGRHLGVETLDELDRAGTQLLIEALRELPTPVPSEDAPEGPADG